MAGKTNLGRSLIVSAVLLLAFASAAGAVMPWRLASEQGSGDGAHVDLVMRKITVFPARAHVGDVVTIEMILEYRGEMINNYYDTTFAEVSANGRVVARKPFVYNFGARFGDEYRETLHWDTTGMAPGRYRIRGEVPLRLDATPFDNFLVVKESVILVPEGAPFSAGEEAGGTAVATNPFLLER